MSKTKHAENTVHLTERTHIFHISTLLIGIKSPIVSLHMQIVL